LTFHSLLIPHHATTVYTTIGADINITGSPPIPKTYQPDAEDILNTITDNADKNLQRQERGRLGRMHKPSTATTPFIHGDEVISKLYQKSMVLIPFTIDPWARFCPMLQAGKEKTEFIEWTKKNINDEITVYLQRHLNSKSITPSEVKRVQVIVGGDHGNTAFQFGVSVSVDLIGIRIIDFEVSVCELICCKDTEK
jgi:hypothetical protein